MKLSSEGEVDADSFSDISDEEGDVFRLKSRCLDTQAEVMHSQSPHSTLSSPSSYKLPVNEEDRFDVQKSKSSATSVAASDVTTTSHCFNKDDDSSKPAKCTTTTSTSTTKTTTAAVTKPKIWSISHILDS